MKTNNAKHNIKPIYDNESKILILGSFPSVKSREAQFYYHHKQNRFWKILSNVYDDSLPETIEEKEVFLKNHHIALWDVIASCDIVGSSDSSITNIVINDIDKIIKESNIKHIYLNGNKACELYVKYCSNEIPYTKLPSSSPANASYSLDKLITHWKIIKEK